MKLAVGKRRRYSSASRSSAGLIGSSLARALREESSPKNHWLRCRCEVRAVSKKLKLADRICRRRAAGGGRRSVVSPCAVGLRGCRAVIGRAQARAIVTTSARSRKRGAGSRKYIGRDVEFVPGHPIAGTEHSGPAAGFAISSSALVHPDAAENAAPRA